MTRKPVVAGQFYPGNPAQLRAFLQEAMPPQSALLKAIGVVAPHAGYVYSGKVAGKVFGRVIVPDAVVLLGPNHTGLGTRASIMSEGAWATPLGTAPIDAALAAALKTACPLLEEDSLAHAHEHSLEVEVPFLQHRNPSVQIVPIALMLRGFDDIEDMGDAIAQVLAGWPDPVLLVASSDMTHYEAHETAKSKDARAIEKVLALDARGLLDTTARHRISMCGVIPAAVVLVAAKRLGATRAELVAYSTSGEASGDYDRVVGYAGLAVGAW